VKIRLGNPAVTTIDIIDIPDDNKPNNPYTSGVSILEAYINIKNDTILANIFATK
jgi:hypothetical protein